jgi:hypothetical protein
MKKRNELKVGGILVAAKNMRMFSGESALIRGEEYPIVGLTETDVLVKTKAADKHYFDLRPSDESYWKKYFTYK